MEGFSNVNNNNIGTYYMSEPRTRTREETPKYGTISSYRNGILRSSFETLNSALSEVMTDSVTKDFHQLIAAGHIINNPMSYVKHSVESTTSGSYHASAKVGSTEYARNGSGCLTTWERTNTSYLDPGHLNIIEVPPELLDNAKRGALSTIDSTPYAFGEDVLEIRETIRFIRKPLSGIYKLSRTFKKAWKKKRRGLKDARDISEAFASLWLQFRFALMPLLRSADQIANFRAIYIPPKPIRRNARGWEKYEHFDSDNPTMGTAGNSYTWERTLSQKFSLRAVIHYEVTNPLEDWKYSTGLRAKDIPETIWAVVPYSFMVDRLYNISETISGIVNFLDPNVNILAASVTSSEETIRSIGFIRQDHSSYHTSVSPDFEIFRDFSKDRAVWTPTVLDAFGESTPPGLVDDITKITDLISLILVNFRK